MDQFTIDWHFKTILSDTIVYFGTTELGASLIETFILDP